MHITRRFATRLLSARIVARAVALSVLAASLAGAQASSATIIVRVTAAGTPLSGVSVTTRSTTIVSDGAGRATFKLPIGTYTFRTAPSGFRPETLSVFVGVGTTMRDIAVRPLATTLPSVAITPDKSSTVAPTPLPAAIAVSGAARRTIAATHVQVIDRAALDEQIEQSPGVISDALGRLDGVRMQPLSAGSSGVGIRIRGLPARYTKILMNGLPLVGSTPEGQDALQISALGVDHVDVTPGVTSAFAGANALSGVVNVVSAAPKSPSQVVVNGTTRGATDVAAFQTHTFSPKVDASLLLGRHERGASDPDDDGWAEVGGYRRVVVRPNVWWKQSPRTTWFMTGGWMSDDRQSGTFKDRTLPVDIVVRDEANTTRADAGAVGRVQLDTNTVLTVRGSFMRESRERWFRDERERDRRVGLFGDVSATRSFSKQTLTAGVALDRDQYTTLDTENDYRLTTPAVYGEHTWTPSSWLGITSSARVDLMEAGDFVSPRVTVLLRPTPMWTMRVSRANGVYAPTPLTDETETFGLRYVNMRPLQPEHAQGWSLDIDGTNGPIELRASGYRTVVAHPLAVRIPPGSAVGLEIMNADLDARYLGADAAAIWRASALSVTAAYSYVDATRPMIGTVFGTDFEFDTSMVRAAPYTPRHTGRVEAALERANDGLVGVELRYTGRQEVADSSLAPTRSYVTLDARVEKHVRRAILFARGSNLANVHQSQYAPVVRRSSGAARQFADNVWAPLDGLVVNAGVRFTY
ncbi:MAG TPA: TonB-dependent receptor [Gemmatimonadaceae bacterium]|jgi:iron complex outermembrane receptor protein